MENDKIPEEDLPSVLRQEAGREWTEEAAEDEYLTEELRKRRLDLIAVAEDAAHRGFRATAEFDGKVMSGPILGTGLDYVTLGLADQEAEVDVASAVWSFIAAQDPSGTPRRTEMTLRGRLAEHAAEENRVRIELAGGDALMGTVTVVSEDHIRVKDPDGRDVYVSMGLLRAIIRSTSQH